MTNPVAPPAAPTVPVYPALGSPSFNQEAYTFGSSMPGVSTALGNWLLFAWRALLVVRQILLEVADPGIRELVAETAPI